MRSTWSSAIPARRSPCRSPPASCSPRWSAAATTEPGPDAMSDRPEKLERAEQAVHAAADRAAGKAHAAVDWAADGVQRGAARTREALDGVVDRVDRGVKTARRKVAAIGRKRIDRAAADALDVVRRHPGKIVALCFAT